MKQILVTLITVTTFMLNGCSSTDKIDVKESGTDNEKLALNSDSSSFRIEPEQVKQNSFRLDLKKQYLQEQVPEF